MFSSWATSHRSQLSELQLAGAKLRPFSFPQQRSMLSCAMWLGLRQSGKQESTSGQAMSMALAQMTCLKTSMAQMGPPSITT